MSSLNQKGPHWGPGVERKRTRERDETNGGWETATRDAPMNSHNTIMAQLYLFVKLIINSLECYALIICSYAESPDAASASKWHYATATGLCTGCCPGVTQCAFRQAAWPITF